MKLMKIVPLLIMIILSGCVPKAYDTKEEAYLAIADESSIKAFSELEKGNWASARKWFSDAVVGAQLGKAKPEALAILYYEYGRTLGVVCKYDESEFFLNKANKLDAYLKGPRYMSLVELARLSLDQKKWDKTIDYFDQAMPELERINVQTKAPHAYADILDEYAKALEGLNKPEATEYHQRANDIRKKYPQGHSITDRTPYGTQCTN